MFCQRLIFCPFRLVTTETNNYSLKMLNNQRGVAIGNAKKAEEAFEAGTFVLFLSLTTPSNSLPIPAREVCVQTNLEKTALIIIYKAKKADIKERKDVSPTTQYHAHTHTHAHAHALARSTRSHTALLQ